jgi:hypothetical protein
MDDIDANTLSPSSPPAEAESPIEAALEPLGPAAPAAKKPRSKIWILGGIGLGVLFCLVVCGLIFGAAVVKAMVEKPKAEKVLAEFMQAMSEDDGDQAYALFSAYSKKGTSLADIEKMLSGKNFVLFEGYQSLKITNFNMRAGFSTNPDMPQGNYAVATGTISYDGGFTGNFNATLEPDGKLWRIFGIYVTVPVDKPLHNLKPSKLQSQLGSFLTVAALED